MKAISPSILFLFLPLFLCAQQSVYTYVFQISAAEAEALYQKEGEELYSDPYLYNLIDSSRSRTPVLPTGHYLLVHAQEEALNIRQYSVHHHTVQQLKNGNQLSVAVLDTSSQLVEDGHLSLAGKTLQWQQSMACYSVRRIRSDGWLRVELPGDTLFYQVEHDKIKPQRRRFFRTSIGYFISSPIRWTKNTYHFLKRGFGRGNWHRNKRRFWPFPRRNRQLRGYLALNQPTFRPGDTLRVKIYLTKRNGRPLEENLEMRLYGYRQQKLLTRILEPQRPGAFTSEIVLADSLQLDQIYQLYFSVPGENGYGNKEKRFKLEDYELDAATFTVELSEKAYSSGEPILITASGKDQNGNPLPGANVELIALREAVSEIAIDSLLIPDTLWTHQQDLSLREDLIIRLPDSILPPADLRVKIEAFFSAASGESTQKNTTFQYSNQAGKLDYSLEDGQWHFRYLESDSSRSRTVYLQTYLDVPPFLQKDTISLPYQLPLDPFVKAYTLEDDQELIISLEEEDNGVQVFGQHRRDSLVINLVNPHHLRIRYQLYEGTQPLREGELTESSLLVFPAKPQHKYELQYEYTWAGARQNKEQAFSFYKRQLSLEAEMPDQIVPGQTVQMKVKAVDSKKHPVSGVELVAGAVNGQFNSTVHLSPPQVTYKRRKGFRQRHRFNLNAPEKTHYSPISLDWYQRMTFHNELYYNIRYPEQGVFEQRDSITKNSFYLGHPQISPYLVKDHKLQPVYLIYLNRELVYSHFSQDNSPFAFNARPGYNQLRLRTREAEYRIDSIYMQPGEQLSIAIDADTYGFHPLYGSKIKRTPAPVVLSQAERELLNRSMFQIRKEEKRSISYLYFDSRRIYTWQNIYTVDAPRIIGPVPPNEKLTYLQRDGLRNTFFYEPGFVYELREGRERLYAHPFLGDKTTYTLPRNLAHPQVGQLSLSPTDIVAVSPKEKKINFRTSWNPDTRGGDLQIFRDQSLTAIVLQNANGKYSVFQARQLYLDDLPQGYYKLTLIAYNGETSSKVCWIYPHCLQILDFRGATYTQDTTLSVLEDLYSLEPTKPSFINYRGARYNNYAGNPYQDVGYLAKGTAIDEETGEPLIGASILLLGTAIGTVTDLDGSWSLWVPGKNAVLQISYTGYSTQQLKARDTSGKLGLADGVSLDEVVVTGYRLPLIEQDNTTQGGTLTSDQIRRLPTRNINALATSTSGLSVIDEGGALNIRGSRELITDYYVDGVRVSKPVPGAELLLSGSGLRSEFRDYAFWETDLITDERGEAYFTVTFPDDITQWKTFVMGMDDRKQAGVWFGETAAFKPVLAQLYLPRFLLPGDQIDLVGSSVNYTNDTFQISTQLEVEGELVLEQSHQLVDGITDQVSYMADTGRDSLTAKYTLQTGNYWDGEERSIPIFKVGTEETIGSFHRLQGDTTIELGFPSADGPVTIYAQPDMLRLMLEEMEALIHYPYGCNEQSASRLLALLMQREVWQALERPLLKEDKIQKMVALLRQRQLADGSWGWWGGSKRNQWMTIYVLRALYTAKQAGYATEAYEKGMLFLTNQLRQLEGKERLEAIALFSEVGQNMDYAALLTPYDSLPGLNWTTLTTTLIKAQQGLAFQLDTLAEYRKSTLFDGHYWGEEGYGFYNNQQQYSLLAYRIYEMAGQIAALDPIQQFFLEQRHRSPSYHRWGGYRNTFEAALILRTIIPDLLKDYQNKTALDFEQEVQIVADETISWETLPQQTTISPTSTIRIQKTGVGQTFLTAYQQRWNPQPKRVEGPFVVTTSLWQGNRQTDQLEQSRAARLKVELTVEKAADYVLLEVPVPAGCSYGDKTQNWKYTETYREYFRDKVAIFCEHLEPGNYTYYIELEPRFTGEFQLNPAKAEQMYFPVFYGREGMKRVRIEEGQ